VSEVKIDASFVRRLGEPEHDDAYRIVRSIIDLVRSLGLRSVAEGVETDEVARRLAEMGCDVGQGWWFGDAMPPDQATVWLRTRRSLLAVPAGPAVPMPTRPRDPAGAGQDAVPASTA